MRTIERAVSSSIERSGWSRSAIILLFSFFSVGWLFRAEGLSNDYEALYSLLIIGATAVCLMSIKPHVMLPGRSWMILIAVTFGISALSLLSSGSVFIWAREFAMVGWLIGLFLLAYNEASRGVGVLTPSFSVLRWHLLASFVSVAASGFFGELTSEYEIELVDKAGLYLLSTDLICASVIISIALLSLNSRQALVWITLCSSVILTALNFSKTHMVALVVAVGAMMIASSRGRLFSALSFFVAFLIGSVAVLSFDNKFKREVFFSYDASLLSMIESDNLSLMYVNSSGRFYTWSHLLDRTADTSLGMLVGKGLGASKYILQSDSPTGYPIAPHSDYVRIIGDVGLTGLIAYLAVMFFLLRFSWKMSADAPDPMVRKTSAVFFALLCYMLICGIGYEILNRQRHLLALLAVIAGVLESHAQRLSTGLGQREKEERIAREART